MAERETTARVRRSTVHSLTISTPYVSGKEGITLGLVRDFVDAAIEAGLDPTTPIRIQQDSPHDSTARRLAIWVRTGAEDDRG